MLNGFALVTVTFLSLGLTLPLAASASAKTLYVNIQCNQGLRVDVARHTYTTPPSPVPPGIGPHWHAQGRFQSGTPALLKFDVGDATTVYVRGERNGDGAVVTSGAPGFCTLNRSQDAMVGYETRVSTDNFHDGNRHLHFIRKVMHQGQELQVPTYLFIPQNQWCGTGSETAMRGSFQEVQLTGETTTISLCQ